eukprot:14888327-Alexandrium_andersonii.AAC.1
MADAGLKVDELALLHEQNMADQGSQGAAAAAAGQGSAGHIAAPPGRWSAPSLPSGNGGLPPGRPGTWLL